LPGRLHRRGYRVFEFIGAMKLSELSAQAVRKLEDRRKRKEEEIARDDPQDRRQP
jgi:hypothetical protein